MVVYIVDFSVSVYMYIMYHVLISVVNECQVLNPCSHICEDKKIGYQCKCHTGFELGSNNRTCVG